MDYTAKSIPNPKRIYPAATRCIWCWPPTQGNPPRGEEHIIPLSFGGNLVLPHGSCHKCEAITTRFETKCLNGMIDTARYHMGLTGRSKIKRSKLPVYFHTENGQTRVPVAIEDHPSVLMLPTMRLPGALLGLDGSHSLPPSIGAAITPITPDFQRRLVAFGDRQINLTKGLDALSCYQLIAKISHAFLAAELGVDGFVSTVHYIVKSKVPVFADHWIGGAILQEGPASTLHEISFEKPIPAGEWEFLVVKIRLFAHIPGVPTYYSVAGRRRVAG